MLQPRINHVQLRLRLLQRNVRLQTRDGADSRIRAACLEAIRRESDGYSDVRILRILETLRGNSDNCVALVVESDLFAGYVLIAAEPSTPLSIAQDHSWSCTLTIVVGEKVAAQEWLDAKC